MTKGIVSAALGVVVLALVCARPVHAENKGGIWTSKAPAPIGVAEVGVAALDGKVYVLGGSALKGQGPPLPASTTNLVYDPANDSWKERAPLPIAISHLGVTALDGKIYVIGGFTGVVHMGPQNRAFVYDPKTDHWSELPKLSSARGSVSAAAVDGKIHVFGGRISDKIVKISPPGAPEMFAGNGTVTTHDIYDPASGKWSQGKPMPAPPRDHMGIAVLDGKIHLFGGRTTDFSDLLVQHDVYDPKTDTWTSAAPLPVPRSSGAYTVLDGLILYAGGECKPGGQPMSPNAFDDVTAYDSKTNSWSQLAPLPKARHAFGAAAIGNVAYFVGGAPICGGGALNDMLAFTLSKN